MAHIGEICVLTLLLNVDGGGLLTRVLHADEVRVLALVLDAGDVDTTVVSLLLLYFALGVVVSHGSVERAPLGPACASALCLLH